MALACQRNSYEREFQSVVKSCKDAELKTSIGGKKQTLKGFEVVLEDTILFPEGGGQPDDRGTINDVAVLRVTRRGQDAVHFVESEIPVGTEVAVKLDWTRRFDHMQQHSGQHLITAMAEQMFGCPTTTWNLGEKTCFIELDIPTLTKEQINELEMALNEKIRVGVPVTPVLYDDKDHPELKKARCRGLPDDHEGPVRVLSIGDLDCTLCCGTHVSNVSDLQMIKLLSVEKGKKKNSVNLNFVCGQRVLDYLSRAVDVEKPLTVLLKGPLDQHFDLAEKAVKGYKASGKVIQTLLRDVATLEGEKFKAQEVKPAYFIYHKKEGDIDFLNTLMKEINDTSVLCLLTAGDDKGAGFVMLSGPEVTVKELGPRVMELMEGKGGYSNSRFQGKANKMGNRTKAAKLVMEQLAGNKAENKTEGNES